MQKIFLCVLNISNSQRINNRKSYFFCCCCRNFIEFEILFTTTTTTTTSTAAATTTTTGNERMKLRSKKKNLPISCFQWILKIDFKAIFNNDYCEIQCKKLLLPKKKFFFSFQIIINCPSQIHTHWLSTLQPSAK